MGVIWKTAEGAVYVI